MMRGAVLASIAATLWGLSLQQVHILGYEVPQLSQLQILYTVFGLYIASGGYYTIWILYMTLFRDVKSIWFSICMVRCLKKAIKENKSVPKLFRTTLEENPNKVAFIFENTTWTFSQLDEYSSRVANHLKYFGVRHGEVIALYMENCPEYVAIWLGCSKIGAVCAMINFNLRSDCLLHCIQKSGAKVIICAGELTEAMGEVHNKTSDTPLWVSGLGVEAIAVNGMENLDLILQSTKTTCPNDIEAIGMSDTLMYIYTSGTTGMPKAAITTHNRYISSGTIFANLCNLSKNDILYNPLPLYHSMGGIFGTAAALLSGCTVVMRKKFSASQYWTEAKKHNCTVSLYIGEMCRFLLNTTSKPEEKAHKIHRILGIGLRPELWKEFVARFNIPKIFEIYGSSEGNIGLANLDGKVGAIGHLPVLFPKIIPFLLVKKDPDTGDYLRDINGLCIPSKPGETGEVVGIIREYLPGLTFHGYLEKEDRQKKIIRDVRTKGDSAFASGDILLMDKLGFLYFMDRIGDTFRWYGENVSTMEVECQISKILRGKNTAVFGVKIPGCEGAAGMAAIEDSDGTVEILHLSEEMKKVLPAYARPVFLRICKSIDLTGTFKIKKVNLKKEGFDPSVVSDPLYCLDTQQKKYLPLTHDLYQNILQSKAGF